MKKLEIKKMRKDILKEKKNHGSITPRSSTSQALHIGHFIQGMPGRFRGN